MDDKNGQRTSGSLEFKSFIKPIGHLRSWGTDTLPLVIEFGVFISIYSTVNFN